MRGIALLCSRFLRTRYIEAGAAVLLVGAASLAGSGSAAAAGAVSCGDVVTQSIVVANDLTCTGTALWIENDSNAPIVVDLGGHIILSTGSPDFGTLFVGIASANGSADVTVEHGTVTGAGIGDYAGRTTFQDLTIDGGYIGATEDNHPVVRFNHFIHGAGYYTSQNSSDVEYNEFTGPGAGTAMQLDEDYATVVGNTVDGYDTAVSITGEGSSANIHGNLFAHNRIGIQIGGGGGDDEVFGSIYNNRIADNTGDGLVLGVGTGINFGRAIVGFSVTNNELIDNGGDGIHVDTTPAHQVGNDILGINATISDNIAVRNGLHGIESPGTIAPDPSAPPFDAVTVIDGGGNIARHNGTAPECVNVLCAKTPSRRGNHHLA